MVSTPKIGDIIKMRAWHGVVLDVLAGSSGRTVLRVQTVRNLFRRLNPEFIEFDLAPDVIAPATLDDLQQEICLLYTSPTPRDRTRYRMPSSA